MREKSLRAVPQVLFAVAVVAALAGCTMTPWGTSESYNGTSGTYQTNGAATNPVPAGFYRVNPGDTLPGIASAYGQRPQDLARWNGLAPNASVSVGQILRVAPPVAASSPPVTAPATSGGAVAQQGVLM
jgi:lipoprotein NlpD